MDALRDPGLNIGRWLSARARSDAERPAVIDAASGESLGYAELDARCNRIAARLAALGVRAGDRVALAIASGPDYLALYFAAAKLGAILLPLNTRLAAPELAFQLEDSDSKIALVDGSAPVPERTGTLRIPLGEFLASLPVSAPEPELAPGGEAPHAILYTSGTTGRPKGALLPHRKTLHNTLNAEHFFALTREDVVLIPVPLFHSYGLKILAVPSLFCGATAVLVDAFDPSGLQELLAKHRATLLGAVPVMYKRMLRAGLCPELWRGVRLAFSAGAALDPSLLQAYAGAGVCVIEGYGQTETSILCCMDAEHALRKPGSVGRPVLHGEIRIADERGKTVPIGATGEIVVRGPICMLGYWRREQESEQARIDGWHRTGDLGTMDADGYVRLVGRHKDMYISGGENVYPAEVERVLEQHPDVVEAAVVGVPDSDWGETGRAYVVLARGSLDVPALTAHVRAGLARYKCPRQWRRVDALPRTASGKIQKHLLVERDRG
jgi:fatty-acyl-CoA synthase